MNKEEKIAIELQSLQNFFNVCDFEEDISIDVSPNRARKYRLKRNGSFIGGNPMNYTEFNAYLKGRHDHIKKQKKITIS
jgi:hypothetical protein